MQGVRVDGKVGGGETGEKRLDSHRPFFITTSRSDGLSDPSPDGERGRIRTTITLADMTCIYCAAGAEQTLRQPQTEKQTAAQLHSLSVIITQL